MPNPKEYRLTLQLAAAQEYSLKWNDTVDYGAYIPDRSIYIQSQT